MHKAITWFLNNSLSSYCITSGDAFQITKKKIWTSHTLKNEDSSSSLSSLVLDTSQNVFQKGFSKGNLFVYHFVHQDSTTQSSPSGPRKFNCTLRTGDYVVFLSASHFFTYYTIILTSKHFEFLWHNVLGWMKSPAWKNITLGEIDKTKPIHFLKRRLYSSLEHLRKQYQLLSKILFTLLWCCLFIHLVVEFWFYKNHLLRFWL